MKSVPPADQVVLVGDRALANLLYGGPGGQAQLQCSLSISELSAAILDCTLAQRPFSFGPAPYGMTLRDVFQANGVFVFLIEEEPSTRTVRWLRDDSPAPYGSKATYRNVTISLPWLYFFVAVSAEGVLSNLNSVYFRNSPLQSLNDILAEPHFFNCSVDAYGVHCWICVQYVAQREKALGQSLLGFVDQFLVWFWSSGFNASSEHHEGNSFWGQNRHLINDPRIRTIDAWEKATRDDPLFALSVPWIDSRYTALGVCQELTASRQLWCPSAASHYAAFIKKHHTQDEEERND